MAAIELLMIPLATTLTNFVLGLYLIIRKKLGDVAANFLIVYLLVTALWQIGPVYLAHAGWPWLGVIEPTNLFLFGFVPGSVLLWLTVRAFLQLEDQPLWPWPAIGAVLLVMALLNRNVPLALASVQFWDGQVFTQHHLFLFVSTLAWGTFTGLAVFTALTAYFQTQSPRHRNRIQFLISAIFMLLFGQMLYLTQIRPVQDASLFIHWLGATIFTYIVVRENLPDISTTLKEIFSFLVITGFTITVYLLIIYAVQVSISLWVTGPNFLVAVAAALVLTFTYPPLNNFLRKLLRRVLFGGVYDPASVIQAYGQAINNVLYLTDLTSLALRQIGQTLSVDKKALLLLERESAQQLYFRIMAEPAGDHWPEQITLNKDTPVVRHLAQKGEPLDQYTIDVSADFRLDDKAERVALKALAFDVFVPVRRNQKLIGLIALGPKNPRQPYTLRDLNLLLTLADQTAIALANAQLFDTLKQNLRETTRIKNLMDNVFASIASGVITTDTANHITMLNQAAQRILETTDNGEAGKSFEDILPWLSNTALPLLIRDVIAHEKTYDNYEIAPHLPRRGRVELSMSLAPLKDGRSETKGVAIVVDDRTETNRLRAVRDMFRKYLSPVVVDRLPADPGELQLGGQRQQVTVLFADIRGFTTFSEKLSPEELIDILNQYLSLAADSILAFEGTLDKFMGDAIMAIFNAPLTQPDHALRAVAAAAAMQQAITAHQPQSGASLDLTFGIGVHTGDVVVGNIGTEDRMDYTAVGDAVNLAKRLQENAPGGTILMSEQVLTHVKAHTRASPFKLLQVKGRSEAVQTYELLEVRLPEALSARVVGMD
jgi:class 3 adenylate cyclase/PAS domain-containing protein